MDADSGKRAGVPSNVADRMKARERENRQVRQANDILRKPVLSLPKRPPHILRWRSSTAH